MFLILTILSLLLTTLTYGKSACDDREKYRVSMAIHGHCFFEPPDNRYEDQIQIKLDKGNGFVLAKAKDLCWKHYNSTILRYDMRNVNKDSIAKAIRKFIETEMRIKYPIPIDCYTESEEDNPHDLDCTQQWAPFTPFGYRSNQSLLFIVHPADYGVMNKQSGGHGDERYWSNYFSTGLILSSATFFCSMPTSSHHFGQRHSQCAQFHGGYSSLVMAETVENVTISSR